MSDWVQVVLIICITLIAIVALGAYASVNGKKD